jgi:hypothetical protein
MKNTLLVSAALCILAGLSAVAAYVVVDGLSGEAPGMRWVGLIAFPVGLAVAAWAASRRESVRLPSGLGVLAVVIGIGAAQAGPTFAVFFGSFFLGLFLYVLGWMLRRLPAVARGQRPQRG